jgi:hypothetical protein
VPAIANAIYDALGIRCDRLPFSPPAVLRALRAEDTRARWESARRQPGIAAGAPIGARRAGA